MTTGSAWSSISRSLGGQPCKERIVIEYIWGSVSYLTATLKYYFSYCYFKIVSGCFCLLFCLFYFLFLFSSFVFVAFIVFHLQTKSSNSFRLHPWWMDLRLFVLFFYLPLISTCFWFVFFFFLFTLNTLVDPVSLLTHSDPNSRSVTPHSTVVIILFLLHHMSLNFLR